MIPERVELRAQGRQAGGVGLVDAPVALGAVHHQARILEHPQVLGDRGAADRQITGKLANSAGPLRDVGEDLASRRVAQRGEPFGWVSKQSQ